MPVLPRKWSMPRGHVPTRRRGARLFVRVLLTFCHLSVALQRLLALQPTRAFFDHNLTGALGTHYTCAARADQPTIHGRANPIGSPGSYSTWRSFFLLATRSRPSWLPYDATQTSPCRGVFLALRALSRLPAVVLVKLTARVCLSRNLTYACRTTITPGQRAPSWQRILVDRHASRGDFLTLKAVLRPLSRRRSWR
jgi:hypothetical protein